MEKGAPPYSRATLCQRRSHPDPPEPMNAPLRFRLPPGLYALCDDTLRPEVPLEHKAARLLEGGVRVMQLRMKRTPLREALGVARAVVAACRRAGAVCLVNDRVDLALLDRKSTRLNSSHSGESRMPSSA